MALSSALLAAGPVMKGAAALLRAFGGDEGARAAEVVERVSGRVQAEPEKSERVLVAEIGVRRVEAQGEADVARLDAERALAAISSGDPFVRRWRPTFGYIVAGCLACQMLLGLAFGTAALLGAEPPWDALVKMLGALNAPMVVALGVLGVGVASRSGDKRTLASLAAGEAPRGGLLDLLGRRGGGR